MKQHAHDISPEEFIAFQTGDPKAFQTIYSRYQAILYRFAFSICNDQFTAEEAVQESFIALHQHKHAIDTESGIYPYLFVATRRYLIKSFRKSVVRARYRHELSGLWTEAHTTAEEDIKSKDLSALLNNLIDQLPEGQRKVFAMNKLLGYSCEEIAQETNTSKHTVKNQLSSASKKIRWRLSRLYSLFF